MKNIILIISVFFSLSAFGAAKVSITGLEGWGKIGVNIIVEDYSKIDKTFPLQAIKTKVELRLLQAGIKVNDKPTGQSIYINAQPINVGGRVVGYAVRVEPNRSLDFKALDNTGKLVTYRTYASSRSYGGIAPAGAGLIPHIDKRMDRLLLEHIKANPKN